MSEDIVKSKLPWKYVLQQVSVLVCLFVISDAIQYICHTSDVNMICGVRETYGCVGDQNMLLHAHSRQAFCTEYGVAQSGSC